MDIHIYIPNNLWVVCVNLAWSVTLYITTKLKIPDGPMKILQVEGFLKDMILVSSTSHG